MMLLLCFLLLAAQVALSGSSNGEQSWGHLRQEWEVCSTGKLQSPIDISPRNLELVFARSLLQAKSNITTATVTNVDLNVELAFPENAGTLVIDGVSYQLESYHIHIPSEHTVDGTRYDMEGHVVHVSSDGRISVVGILYRIGRDEDAFVKQFQDLLAEEGEAQIDRVDPSKLRITGNPFYRYNGSLTTPPCTEGVTWSILGEPQTLSRKQFQLIQHALKGENARSLQSLNGRKVCLYVLPKLFDITSSSQNHLDQGW